MIFGFRLGDIDLHVIVELAGRLPLAAAAGACLWIDIVMNQLIFGNVVRKLAKLAVMFAVRFLATVLFRVAVGRFLPIWLGPIVLAALAKLGFEFLDAGVALGERRIALGERFAKLLDLGIALGERLAKFGELEFELARPVVRVLGAIHDALICATMSQSTKSNLLNSYIFGLKVACAYGTEGVMPSAAGFQNAREKLACARLPRSLENLIRRPFLQDDPLVKEKHTIGDIACEIHFMSHDEHGHVRLVGQLSQDVKNLTD